MTLSIQKNVIQLQISTEKEREREREREERERERERERRERDAWTDRKEEETSSEAVESHSLVDKTVYVCYA